MTSLWSKNAFQSRGEISHWREVLNNGKLQSLYDMAGWQQLCSKFCLFGRKQDAFAPRGTVWPQLWGALFVLCSERTPWGPHAEHGVEVSLDLCRASSAGLHALGFWQFPPVCKHLRIPQIKFLRLLSKEVNTANSGPNFALDKYLFRVTMTWTQEPASVHLMLRASLDACFRYIFHENYESFFSSCYH